MKSPPLAGRIAIIIGLLVMLAVLALSGCATVPEGSMQVTIPAGRVAQCKEQGGCALLSHAQALEIALQAYEEGAKAAMESLDSHGCRRGSL